MSHIAVLNLPPNIGPDAIADAINDKIPNADCVITIVERNDWTAVYYRTDDPPESSIHWQVNELNVGMYVLHQNAWHRVVRMGANVVLSNGSELSRTIRTVRVRL